jgi:hypothetical protein
MLQRRLTMRTLLISALAVGLVLTGSVRAPAQDAKAILDKAVKVSGGLERLTKFRAVQTNVKGKLEAMGGLEFTQEASMQEPDKIKAVVHLTVNGMQVTVTTVYNGKQGWINANGQTIDMPPGVMEAMKDAVEVMTLTRLAFAGGKDFEASLLGESKVNDRPVVGVKVSRKEHKDVNLYFDKDSGLLVKMEHRAKDESGQEVDEERILSDYHDVDGHQVPKKVVVTRGGKKYLEAEVTDMKFLEKLEDSEFAKP